MMDLYAATGSFDLNLLTMSVIGLHFMKGGLDSAGCHMAVGLLSCGGCLGAILALVDSFSGPPWVWCRRTKRVAFGSDVRRADGPGDGGGDHAVRESRPEFWHWRLNNLLSVSGGCRLAQHHKCERAVEEAKAPLLSP